jgi:CBS-domain-containing membrane protein
VAPLAIIIKQLSVASHHCSVALAIAAMPQVAVLHPPSLQQHSTSVRLTSVGLSFDFCWIFIERLFDFCRTFVGHLFDFR